jgi:hypothetical protein
MVKKTSAYNTLQKPFSGRALDKSGTWDMCGCVFWLEGVQYDFKQLGG